MALVMNKENGRLQHGRGFISRDLVGIMVIIAVAAVGYFAFPDNLALLTRMITIAWYKAHTQHSHIPSTPIIKLGARKST